MRYIPGKPNLYGFRGGQIFTMARHTFQPVDAFVKKKRPSRVSKTYSPCIKNELIRISTTLYPTEYQYFVFRHFNGLPNLR
jgi:hypothetical protein